MLKDIFHFFVHICGAYQRIFFGIFIFYCIFKFFRTRGVDCAKKTKAHLEVCFFALKLIFFVIFPKWQQNVVKCVCFVMWHTYSNHHNNLHFQLSIPSIKGTQQTNCWPIYVFSFLVVLSKINTYLVIWHFVFKTKDPKIVPRLIESHQELSWQLINNDHWRATSHLSIINVGTKAPIHKVHDHCVAPSNAKYYSGHVRILGAKDKYQTYQCKAVGCNKCTWYLHVCISSILLCSICNVKYAVDFALVK